MDLINSNFNVKDEIVFVDAMTVYRLTTCPVLECAVRVADETSNRTIECPVLAQTI
jgi:hypothetical protein